MNNIGCHTRKRKKQKKFNHILRRLMMNKKVFRSSLVLALIVALAWVMLFPVATPAAQARKRKHLKPTTSSVPSVSQKIWVSDDGILPHSRQGSAIRCGIQSMYHAGTGQIISNANIDLATMYGEYHGTLAIYPTAFDGYWAGSWVLQITPAGQNGHARLKGYGDLEGWQIKAELTYLPPPVLAKASQSLWRQPTLCRDAFQWLHP